MERKEAVGETELHAPESGGAQAGCSSEGLAVEQLGPLRKGRERIASDRPHEMKSKAKPAPLNPKGAAPPRKTRAASRDWPWSSWCFYFRGAGLLQMDPWL